MATKPKILLLKIFYFPNLFKKKKKFSNKIQNYEYYEQVVKETSKALEESQFQEAAIGQIITLLLCHNV